jgi:MoxR-like ATPase
MEVKMSTLVQAAGMAGGGVDTEAALARRIRVSVGRAVVGQDIVVERILIALLTGGHLLLQGVPGLAKTLLVSALAKSVSLKFSRVQFTIDLLPADILGAEILEEGDDGRKRFVVHNGPVFTNLLLADEINRATPKVQSALLEAMQERKVTIGSTGHRLPTPFLVIATQNPVEQAGTFELPEAQLDRFMMCHRLTYPTKDQETEVLRRSLGYGLVRQADGGAVPKSAFDAIEDDHGAVSVDDLTSAMGMVQKVHVSDVLIRHVIDLVDKTRNHSDVELGCSPRAGIALLAASRARAWIKGRDYAVPDDLFALAEDVLLHRMRLSYDALARGRTGPVVLRELLEKM